MRSADQVRAVRDRLRRTSAAFAVVRRVLALAGDATAPALEHALSRWFRPATVRQALTELRLAGLAERTRRRRRTRAGKTAYVWRAR